MRFTDGTTDVLLSRAACVHICRSMFNDDASLAVFVVNKAWSRWMTKQRLNDTLSNDITISTAVDSDDIGDDGKQNQKKSSLVDKKARMRSLMTAKIPIGSFLDEITKEFRDTPKGT